MVDFSATYIATRELTAGHVLDSSQTFDIDLRQLVPATRINASQVLTPTDAETEFDYYVQEYDVQTKMMDNPTMLLCHEFLLSNSSSEMFTLSLLGAPARNAQIILNKKLKPISVGPLKFRYSFKVRVY